MNLEKHLNARFQKRSIKRRYNNFEKYSVPLIGEFETDYNEIISRKRTICILEDSFILLDCPEAERTASTMDREKSCGYDGIKHVWLV